MPFLSEVIIVRDAKDYLILHNINISHFDVSFVPNFYFYEYFFMFSR